jgi:hypothetical protein
VKTAISRFNPVTPVGRVDADRLLGLRVQPASEDSPTWKDQRVDPASIKHGQLQIAIKRCGGARFPTRQAQAAVFRQEALESFRVLVALRQAIPALFQLKKIRLGLRVGRFLSALLCFARMGKAIGNVIAQSLKHKKI